MPGELTIPMSVKIGLTPYFCECVGETEDTLTRQIVEHNIIGYDGAKLEDTGLNSRKFNLHTIWRDAAFYAHDKFLKAYADNRSEVVIAHPIYGDAVGSINSVSVSNVYNEIDCAHIKIEFTEHGTPTMHNGYLTLVYGAIFPKGALTAIDMNEYASAKISGLAAFLGSINSIKQVVGQAASKVNMATAMANTVIDAAMFPATIPGQFVEMAVRAVESANGIKDKLLQSPASEISRIRAAMGALCRNLEEFFEPSGGEIMADLIRSYTVFNECLMIAQVCDNAIANPQRILTQDIEASLNMMRRFAKEVIQKNREDTAALADAVNEITNAARITMSKINNERIVTVVQETTIYNVLLMYNITRDKAQRICIRNWIENPNSVRGRLILPQADY
jgi:prophage DNA circulation protein